MLEDLLNSQELGVVVTGFIESAEAPHHVTGIGKGGRSYSFWNRRITVKVSNKGDVVIVAQTRDKETDFTELDMSGIVSFRIARARMDGSQMILNEENLREA